MRFKRIMAAMLPFLTLFAVSALAKTNTDALGLSGLWQGGQGGGGGVKAWLSDGYVTKVLGLIFFCVGVWRAFAGSILQFFFMLGFAILVSQGATIIEAITPAIF